MARKRWLRLTNEEIARVRLLLQRDSTRLVYETLDHDDPNQSIANWKAAQENEYIIQKIDALYKNRS